MKLLHAMLDPSGRVVETIRDLDRDPLVSLTPTGSPPTPPEPPPPLPDIPWTVDPQGVVEDVWPWIADSVTALSPDGSVAWILKSDEVSADGRIIGEWWDRDARYIGHLEDAGSGFRLYQGRRYSHEQWQAFGAPVPWASLRIDRNWWKAGARLWLPRRCETGWERSYHTDIHWTSGHVDPNVPITIRIEVGRGRVKGREFRVRQFYDPRRVDRENPRRKAGILEINDFGPGGWVQHRAFQDDAFGNPVIPFIYPHERVA